ncbi:MAG: HlyD family efflux transporter periplasmic adaptor subunit [Planctomycetes bacterium]|nr:HlyD family efflux transporter periplasmic adaptor subunit [Planctomycetota bacterium]MBI3845722.1 HlyD family efflux transporter periplasmic adaptor subunit [Planctomycetota bacterium]
MIAIIGLPLGIWMFSRNTAGSSSPEATFLVTKGDLRVSVVETGSIRSEKPVKIQSQLEGQNTILKLIPEGTMVREGDIIAELDVSKLLESKAQQEITSERANAAWVQAQKTFDIQKSQNESAITTATLDAEFAEKDLEKYAKGDAPQAIEQTQAEIQLADQELKRAKDRWEWSQKLQAKGFISKSELDADKLAVTKCELDLSIANRKMDVLKTYTQPKDIRKLEAQAQEKNAELERVKQRGDAALVNLDADLKAKKATAELEKARLDKWIDQINKATIKAPQAGMVVYASNDSRGGGMGRNDQPLQEGASVRERETIVTLPDIGHMIADTKIHESALDRVKEGLDAIVSIDALPKTPFRGRVTKVALLPDTQQSWLNPDLKVYTTEVSLVGDTTMLRPGMSCSVEIIVEELHDVLHVPIQAIVTKGKEHFGSVFHDDGTVEDRNVDIGTHNDKFVQVVAGLSEGERVILSGVQSRGESKVSPRNGEPTSNKPDDLPPVPPGARLPEVKAKSEPDGGDESGGKRKGQRPAMTDEMRKRFESMTPEEREKMRNRRPQGQGGDGVPGGPGAHR